jgi:hypothetical protein
MAKRRLQAIVLTCICMVFGSRKAINTKIKTSMPTGIVFTKREFFLEIISTRKLEKNAPTKKAMI